MADVTIGELPSLNTMEADTLIPVEHDGTARSMSGTVLGNYVYGLVEDDVEIIAEIVAIGPPGISPTLSSSKTGKTTTVYFTDATHTTPTVLATLQDGADGTGAGDMTKAIYDTDDDGIVDNSERLGGELPSYYMAASLKGAASGVAELDSYGKVAAAQTTARMVNVTSNQQIGESHNGCVLVCYSAAVTITLPATSLSSGFEVEILRYGSYSVTIQAASGVSLNGVAGGSVGISDRYKSAVLKLINNTNNAWVIQGAIS